MRTFIGYEGHYDIYDNGQVIVRLVNELGRLTGAIKKLSNVAHIYNDADRNGVLHLLQVMKIYKVLGQAVEA